MEVLEVREMLHTFIWGWHTYTDILQQSIKGWGCSSVGGAPTQHEEKPGLCPALQKLGMVVHHHDPSTWVVEAGELLV